MFGLGIFFTFSGLSVLFDVPRETHLTLWGLALYAASFGILAVTSGFVALWDLRLIPIPIALQIGLSMLGKAVTQSNLHLSPAAAHQRLVVDASICFVLVGLGYLFLIRFIHAVARGHAILRTEVTLARRIHDALVPVVSGRSTHVEYYGRSEASGTIGGDLVDVVEHPEGATFYVADVSGHGVGAGVLMAMLRSAAHAALSDGATLPRLLGHLNRTIFELQRPGTFATCAVLHVNRSGRAHYALAGHLPILCKRAGTREICELGEGGPPLGLREHEDYESFAFEVGAGDDFLIVTDGLTEVFGRDQREFGMAGIKSTASANGGTPEQLAESLIAEARRFGKQLDDQTVLSVRVLGGAPHEMR